jgi:hypothetical protein
MGKMKDLGQQLTEKLEAYANAQGARNVGMGMGVQQAMQNAQAAQNMHAAQQMNMYGANQAQTIKSRIVSNMRGVDDPNKREAYAIPLSRLVDMWRIKFEDRWVDVSEIDDEFWMDASSRLHRNKLMEEVEFHASNTPWARLKEDA